MKLGRKKTGIIAGSFHLVGGLNGRDCNAKDHGNDDTGSDKRGYHRPVVVAFNAERLSVLILWHGVWPPLVASEWQTTIGAP